MSENRTPFHRTTVTLFKWGICCKCHEFTEMAQLTHRQVEIAMGVAQGKTVAELANEFFVSKKTIESHRNIVFRITGCRNPAELCRWMYEHDFEETLGWKKGKNHIG